MVVGAEAVAQAVAHMSVVDASQPRSLLAQRHQLLGAGVAARRVIQAGGNAEGPFLHPLSDEVAHLLHLSTGGRTIFGSQDGPANGAVGDQLGRVYT